MGDALPSPAHLITGKHGEEAAVQFLHSLGYRVRATNVRLGKDEIDIVAFDPKDKVMVFAEVRTRKHMGGAFMPEKLAGPRKRYLLFRSARRWVARHDYRGGYRVDLLCVKDGKIVAHFRELTPV